MQFPKNLPFRSCHLLAATSCAESAFGAELRHLRKAAAVEDSLARETLQALILRRYSATATLMWSPVPTPQNGGPQFEGLSFHALLGGAMMELGKLPLKKLKASEFTQEQHCQNRKARRGEFWSLGPSAHLQAPGLC